MDDRRGASKRLGAMGESMFDIEALKRGYIPCKPIVDCGIDRVLQNGATIQIKTARVCESMKGNHWVFSLVGVRYADFAILVAIDWGIFIIPSIVYKDFKGKGTTTLCKSATYSMPHGGTSTIGGKYERFLEAWDLLGEPSTHITPQEVEALFVPDVVTLDAWCPPSHL